MYTTPTPTSPHTLADFFCVWTYRLIRLEVLGAFAHFAWRSHRNAEHTECVGREGGARISQEWHSGPERAGIPLGSYLGIFFTI